MAAPKLPPDRFRKLFQEEEERNRRDKRQIEALTAKLQDILSKNQLVQKKAALILESWINKKPK